MNSKANPRWDRVQGGHFKQTRSLFSTTGGSLEYLRCPRKKLQNGVSSRHCISSAYLCGQRCLLVMHWNMQVLSAPALYDMKTHLALPTRMKYRLVKYRDVISIWLPRLVDLGIADPQHCAQWIAKTKGEPCQMFPVCAVACTEFYLCISPKHGCVMLC